MANWLNLNNLNNLNNTTTTNTTNNDNPSARQSTNSRNGSILVGYTQGTDRPIFADRAQAARAHPRHADYLYGRDNPDRLPGIGLKVDHAEDLTRSDGYEMVDLAPAEADRAVGPRAVPAPAKDWDTESQKARNTRLQRLIDFANEPDSDDEEEEKPKESAPAKGYGYQAAKEYFESINAEKQAGQERTSEQGSDEVYDEDEDEYEIIGSEAYERQQEEEGFKTFEGFEGIWNTDDLIARPETNDNSQRPHTAPATVTANIPPSKSSIDLRYVQQEPAFNGFEARYIFYNPTEVIPEKKTDRKIHKKTDQMPERADIGAQRLSKFSDDSDTPPSTAKPASLFRSASHKITGRLPRPSLSRYRDAVTRKLSAPKPATRTPRISAPFNDLRAYPGSRLPTAQPIQQPAAKLRNRAQPSTEKKAGAADDKYPNALRPRPTTSDKPKPPTAEPAPTPKNTPKEVFVIGRPGRDTHFGDFIDFSKLNEAIANGTPPNEEGSEGSPARKPLPLRIRKRVDRSTRDWFPPESPRPDSPTLPRSEVLPKTTYAPPTTHAKQLQVLTQQVQSAERRAARRGHELVADDGWVFREREVDGGSNEWDETMARADRDSDEAGRLMRELSEERRRGRGK